MKFLQKMVNTIIRNRQKQALNYLQSLPDQQLLDYGFAPELMDKGVDGWPWRGDQPAEPVTTRKLKRSEEERYVQELENCTDAELKDLGIYRGSIRQVVRYGRPGLDDARNQQAA